MTGRRVTGQETTASRRRAWRRGARALLLLVAALVAQAPSPAYAQSSAPQGKRTSPTPGAVPGGAQTQNTRDAAAPRAEHAPRKKTKTQPPQKPAEQEAPTSQTQVSKQHSAKPHESARQKSQGTEPASQDQKSREPRTPALAPLRTPAPPAAQKPPPPPGPLSELPPPDTSVPPPMLPRAPRERMRACALAWTKYKMTAKPPLTSWRDYASKCLTR